MNKRIDEDNFKVDIRSSVERAQQETSQMHNEFLNLEKKVKDETANSDEIRAMRKIAKKLGITDIPKLTHKQLMGLKLF